MAPRPRKETFTVCGEVGARVAVVDQSSVSRSGRRKVVEAGERVNRSRARRPYAEGDAPLRFVAMVSILTISGMIAVHSKRVVFTALAGVPGITSAQVDLGRAVIDHDERVSSEALEAAIASVGCRVVSIERGSARSLPLYGEAPNLD
jgi:copper chaperone CopZ